MIYDRDDVRSPRGERRHLADAWPMFRGADPVRGSERLDHRDGED